jgi:putative endonuclease
MVPSNTGAPLKNSAFRKSIEPPFAVSKSNIQLGKAGEVAAAGFLEKNGYKVLHKNYKSKLGEIDIVALDKETVCFIEVKTRTSNAFGFPYEAVSRFKQRQIAKAALVYLKTKCLLHKKARFDVVSILYAGNTPNIKLVKNAFELVHEFTY